MWHEAFCMVEDGARYAPSLPRVMRCVLLHPPPCKTLHVTTSIGTPLCYCFVAGGKIRAKAGKFKRDPKLQLFGGIWPNFVANSGCNRRNSDLVPKNTQGHGRPTFFFQCRFAFFRESKNAFHQNIEKAGTRERTCWNTESNTRKIKFPSIHTPAAKSNDGLPQLYKIPQFTINKPTKWPSPQPFWQLSIRSITIHVVYFNVKNFGWITTVYQKKVTMSPPLTAFFVKVCNFNQMLPNIYKRLQKML